MKTIVQLVDCTDYKMVYGFLEVEDLPIYEVQAKIYEIKNDEEFLKEFGEDSWTIEDVLSKFPKEWKVEYYDGECTIEI